ncbi:MAG TPA: hypothetical protein VFE02_04655 [Candidatus Acidoferrales bacterium]|nr:hypothetical protein [Candidatus Acidoferrales bacterium]
MKLSNSLRIKLSQILLLSAVVAFALIVPREAKAGDEHVPVVTDWSHRHAVYSEPNSLMKRFALSADHRYLQQSLRRNAERHHGQDRWRWHHAPENPNRIQGDWSMNMGAGATVGAGNYPAKYTFDAAAANCATDFVVYNTSLGGSGTQATIVAFNNIYVGTCTAPNPSTYWAYNTGAGAILTSPILSFDGTRVAFIQNTGGVANLEVLRWKSGDGSLLGPLSPAAGPCTAGSSCLVTVPFSTANSCTATTDSFSSPFYDYGQDLLYVGDDKGCLHKFTGVFFGTPTEVVASGASIWPAQVNGGFGHLNSPVFATGHGQVFVTDNLGVLYSVDTTAGGVPVSGYNFTAKLADIGFDDGPLVDVTTGFVYVFARQSVSTLVTPHVPNVPSVFQIPIPATPSAMHNTLGTQVVISDVGTVPAAAMYVGAFDDPYYSSANGTGELYACGTAGTVNSLWVITLTASAITDTKPGPVLTTANAGCSPITEFNNTIANNDRIFLSVTGSAITGGATLINCPAASGCVMSFDVDSVLNNTGSATSATATETGGTSGIVVDNTAATGGASQVYFTPLSNQACVGAGGLGTGTGGCAIQASQAGLN